MDIPVALRSSSGKGSRRKNATEVTMKIHLSGDKAHLWGNWINTEMRYDTIDSLTGLLDRIQSGGKKKLLIDCAHLGTIDFSGLQFLNIWLQCLKLRGIDHELLNMSETQEESFRGIGSVQAVRLLNPFVHKSLLLTQSKRRKTNESRRNQNNRQAA
jgi:MFS superfamily sulfate permease-like transporter